MAAPDFYCKNFDPALVMNDLIDFSGREIELMHSKDVEVDEFPGSRSAFESTCFAWPDCRSVPSIIRLRDLNSGIRISAGRPAAPSTKSASTGARSNICPARSRWKASRVIPASGSDWRHCALTTLYTGHTAPLRKWR